MSETPPSSLVSIVVPALNEAENLPALCARVQAAMSARPYEMLIVDDNSRDNTVAVAADLATQFPLRLVVRTQPKDGLSGAVLRGMREARGDVFVVMDADLQHPPEKLPELLAQLDVGADFALGSRHVAGASVGEQWGAFRKLNSWVATLLARPFAGRVTDPMSGFFAITRARYESAERLTPLGYKIALELMCKCRVKNVREVPIHFALREKGESKLTVREQFRYLEHLSRLYDFCFPRLSPVVKFSIVIGVSWFIGLAVQQGLMFLLGFATDAHAALRWSIVASYGFVLLATAVVHLRYIRTQREFLITRHPWREFILVGMCEWIACALAVWWMARRVPWAYMFEYVAIAYAVGAAVRYALRKELMQDIRGLRKELRVEDVQRP